MWRCLGCGSQKGFWIAVAMGFCECDVSRCLDHYSVRLGNGILVWVHLRPWNALVIVYSESLPKNPLFSCYWKIWWDYDSGLNRFLGGEDDDDPFREDFIFARNGNWEGYVDK